VLVVARIANGGGSRPLDRFVGLPRHPWTIPGTFDRLLRGVGTVANQEVVTGFGEVVRAELSGLIYTRFLDAPARDDVTGDLTARSDWSVLRSHLSPRRTVTPTAPELFTWSSTFNNARDRWPGVTGLEQLSCLTTDQQSEIANHFLGYGLEALAAESEHLAVRVAAQRLVELCDRGFVDLHLTSHPYGALKELTGRDRYDAHPLLPEEHSLVYVPSPGVASTEERTARNGTILVPLQWIAAANQREIVALVHLVRVASFARDDSFGKLAGSAFGCARDLRTAREIPLFDVAAARADGLAARFLDEALRFDTRIYGLQVLRDDYCRAIEGKAHR
jgi:hypothetical protein